MGKKGKKDKKRIGTKESSVKILNENEEFNDKYQKDSRFSAAANRPQFLPQGKKSEAHKVQIDSRFASVLTDPRFRVDGMGSGGVDKYGRKKKKKKKKAKDGENDEVVEELSAFYTVEKNDAGGEASDSESDKSSSEDNETGNSDKYGAVQVNEEDDKHKQEEEEQPKDSMSRIAYLQALSRGEISGESTSDSSSSDDENESDSSVSTNESDDEEDPLNVSPGILDPSKTLEDENEEPIEITMESSPYLAVLNLDWVHVRAVDIFVILTSFSPPGSVKRVRVFPSDFGQQQMKEEEVMGPTGIWKKRKQKKADQTKEDTGSENEEKGFENESVNEENEGSEDSNLSGEEEEDDDAIIKESYKHFAPNEQAAGENPGEETDFDTEKLREYEASKLRYYFAVAEFNTSKDADVAYRELDGLEMEHSSASFDLRCIAEDQLEGVVQNRELRDEAVNIPSNYIPPDFVVSALQQTNVKCTWEDGDVERSRKLTQYGVGNEMWDAMVEGDDLKAYLASDNSSDEDNDLSDDGKGKKEKGSKMRSLLGLSSDEDNEDGFDDSDDSGKENETDNDIQPGTKEITYIPGQQNLSDKIRTKIINKNQEENETLTPWERYLEKRKEKRREKRKSKREKRKSGGNTAEDKHEKEEMVKNAIEDDDFFLDDDSGKPNKKISNKTVSSNDENNEEPENHTPSTKEELELILAGDNEIEAEKDYDMRGLLRVEKNAGKKLRGARKRKESKLAENVTGKDFKIDTTDERFSALLEGDDRFGINRQDPNFKETAAMKEILAEQTKRRSKKRARKSKSNDSKALPSAMDDQKGSESKELGSLVKSLKHKVSREEKKKKKKQKHNQ